MLYFKNIELAKKYHLSLGTIRNWIEAAQNGRLNIALHTKEGKTYIANTTSNVSHIERLVIEGKKFRPNQRVVTPGSKFYELYNQEQIYDIVTNLTAHREIPLQYNYFDGGADTWDGYSQRLLKDDTPNTLRSTIHLIDSNLDSLDRLLAGRRKVNIIDLGAGNALPVRGLLTHLLKRGVLNRYIAIDISADMLEIARRNVGKWFGDKVAMETYVRDIGYDHFRDLVVEDYLAEEEVPLNLVLLLGGTLSNFRTPDDVLRVIRTGMMPDDLLMHSLKLDTPHARLHFNFSDKSDGRPSSKQLGAHVLSQLGVDESCYELEAYFDEQLMARFINARLKTALTVQLTFGGTTRYIELNKDETIVLHRVWHRNALDVVDLFARSGFDLLQASQTKDHEFLLTISDIRLK
jgi:uncharacterized SAM-dependent methyltransferase